MQHLESQCKHQSTLSPTIRDILTKSSQAPTTPAERKVAGNVIRRIMKQSADTAVIKIPTPGLVSTSTNTYSFIQLWAYSRSRCLFHNAGWVARVRQVGRLSSDEHIASVIRTAISGGSGEDTVTQLRSEIRCLNVRNFFEVLGFRWYHQTSLSIPLGGKLSYQYSSIALSCMQMA